MDTLNSRNLEAVKNAAQAEQKAPYSCYVVEVGISSQEGFHSAF